MRTALLIAIFFIGSGSAAPAQSCPKEGPNGPPLESASRTLSGQVIYHNSIRQWFGLKLDQPVCGEREIQLLQGGGAFEVDESNARAIEVFRGCRVTVEGPLGIPGTGYYSANLYQNAGRILPAASCDRKLALPDYSTAKPNPSVREYRVSMSLDYRERGGHIVVIAHRGNRLLIPWQAYASYWLTGGYVLYGQCAKGFVVRTVFGTPQAKPSHFDDPGTPEDMAAFDPESAAAEHIYQLDLGYTCQR